MGAAPALAGRAIAALPSLRDSPRDGLTKCTNSRAADAGSPGVRRFAFDPPRAQRRESREAGG
jgi:hypothetical protein